MSFFQNHAA